MSRRAMFDIVVGATGCGKSTFLMKNIVEPAKERILVYKNEENVDWADVSFLDKEKGFDELKTFTGIRKMNDKDGRLQKIQKGYKCGILILEDCRGYVKLQSQDFMENFLRYRRHSMVDIFAVFHGLTDVPPYCFKHADRLILFATNDNINKRSKEIYSERLKKIDDARKRIENELKKGNNFAYEIINLDIRL